MTSTYTETELSARLVTAGELLVSGDDLDTLATYFAPDFVFNGPGGFVSDYAGLSAYFHSIRAALADRTIRRGIVVVEGTTIACQTWIEGTFVREFTQAPSGPAAPNGARIVFDLINIFQMDDQGRFTNEYVRTDFLSLEAQLRAPALNT